MPDRYEGSVCCMRCRNSRNLNINSRWTSLWPVTTPCILIGVRATSLTWTNHYTMYPHWCQGHLTYLDKSQHHVSSLVSGPPHLPGQITTPCILIGVRATSLIWTNHYTMYLQWWHGHLTYLDKSLRHVPSLVSGPPHLLGQITMTCIVVGDRAISLTWTNHMYPHWC